MYVCIGANVSVDSIEYSALFDATSTSAMTSGIAQSTGIPFNDVMYEKDASLLCPTEDDEVQSQFVRAEGDVASRRVLSEVSIINFAIRKRLFQTTYIYTVDELSDELRLRISNAMDSKSFSSDIIAAVDSYNATRLQTNEFKVAIADSTLLDFFIPVLQHLEPPTSAPTIDPTFESNSQSDDSNMLITAGLSVVGGLLALALCLMCVVFSLRRGGKRHKIYVADNNESDADDLKDKNEDDDPSESRPLHIVVHQRRDSRESTISALSSCANMLYNKAFIILKPHANTKQCQQKIYPYFTSMQCRVVGDGEVSGEKLVQCFHRQYLEAGRKAMQLLPHECAMSSLGMMSFEKKYGISWSVAVKKRLVYNSRDACRILEATPESLFNAWMDCTHRGKVVRLGRDFHCGLIDSFVGKPAVYCINGYFLGLQAEYSAPSASIHYYCIEWDNAHHSWQQFQDQVVGAEDPSLAHPMSLRSMLGAEWRSLGMASSLGAVRNGLHVSSSAFEALAEVDIWASHLVEGDRLREELLQIGLTDSMLKDWMLNVSVKGQPVFDQLQGKGSRECVEVVRRLLLDSHPQQSPMEGKEELGGTHSPTNEGDAPLRKVYPSSSFSSAAKARSLAPVPDRPSLITRTLTPLPDRALGNKRLPSLSPVDTASHRSHATTMKRLDSMKKLSSHDMSILSSDAESTGHEKRSNQPSLVPNQNYYSSELAAQLSAKSLGQSSVTPKTPKTPKASFKTPRVHHEGPERQPSLRSPKTHKI